jgi:hypothetical protein
MATVAATTPVGQSSTGADRPILSPAGGGLPPVSNAATTSVGPSPATPTVNIPTTTLSVELRDLLDPATVADIRRLEGTKTPNGSVPALERAVAVLRARADALDAQARAMRSSAGQK